MRWRSFSLTLKGDAGKARGRSISNPQVATTTTSQHAHEIPAPLPLDIETFNLPVSSPHRQNLPPWDRTLDAVYHRHPHDHVPASHETSFENALDQFFQDHGREKANSGYFRLPGSVRLRICRLLLAPSNGKPLCLNRFSFNRDVWRTGDFTFPSFALLPLATYFLVSFAFRADVLVAFLQSTTLHALFSPYVGPMINPLATNWLNKYGAYAQNIVVEVDMARLGCGPDPGAADLLPNVEHIEELLHKFADGQLKRGKSRPLESLVLLCRRFYGRRSGPQARSVTERSSASSYSRWSQRSERTASAEDMRLRSPELKDARASSTEQLLRQVDAEPSAGDNEPLTSPGLQSDTHTPLSPFFPPPMILQDYCPDSYLVLCNHLLRLKGRVDSLRMCGFGESYTARFIGTMFPDVKNELERHAYRVAPSTIWPKLSGQKSYVDVGDGYIALDELSAPATVDGPLTIHHWEGCIQFPPPFFDAHGNPCVPPMVGDVQRKRNPAVRVGTSLSERTSDQMRKEAGEGSDAGGEKKRVLKFLDRYGKGKTKKKKRVLDREIATTL
ncbi:hypothetical protein ACJ41O_007101 [Fusarium nematophilum]